MYSSEQLKAFETVVECGTFSAAAQVMGRTQASVSLLIKRFESELGYLVFERNGKRVTLNDNGKALYEFCKRRHEAMCRITHIANGLQDNIETDISVYFDICFPSQILTEALVRFHYRFPHTQLNIQRELEGADLVIVKSEDIQMIAGHEQMDWQSIGVVTHLPVTGLYGTGSDHYIQVPWAPLAPLEQLKLKASHPEVALEMIISDMGWSWIPEHFLARYQQGKDYQLVQGKTPLVEQYSIGSSSNVGPAQSWLWEQFQAEAFEEVSNAG